MNMFEIIIVSIILLLFPLMCYLFYIVANKNIDMKHRDLVLCFTLISLFYIIGKYQPVSFYTILLLSIPLFLSYKKDFKPVTYSLVTLSILLYHQSYYIFFIIINFIFNFVFNREKNFFNYVFIATITALISTLILDINNFLNNSVYLICYIVTANLVYYTITKGEEIINYHIEYKDLKKEHEIRQSLFKITHEIKNPLAVCKAYIDMFDYNDKNCAKKYIPIISGEIDKLLILLQDFLLVNKDNINFDIMDINFLLEDIVASMCELNKVNISLEGFEDEVFIVGDYNRLTQVMTNLIKNSFEAHASKVLIKLSVLDELVEIEIIDNGDGISESDKDKIYKPFYTTKKEGTGLGVSLSKEIVEAHNGSLEYLSDSSGTTAKIMLPLKQI